MCVFCDATFMGHAVLARKVSHGSHSPAHACIVVSVCSVHVKKAKTGTRSGSECASCALPLLTLSQVLALSLRPC